VCWNPDHGQRDDRMSRERGRADRARGVGFGQVTIVIKKGWPRWIEAGTREWLEQREGAPRGRVLMFTSVPKGDSNLFLVPGGEGTDARAGCSDNADTHTLQPTHLRRGQAAHLHR
jgi:hypothetical protein